MYIYISEVSKQRDNQSNMCHQYFPNMIWNIYISFSCPSYTSVPLQCSLQRDPNNACCQLMTCDPQKVVTIQYQTPTAPTKAPFTYFPTTHDPHAPPTARPVPTIYSPNGTMTLPPTDRPATGMASKVFYFIFFYIFWFCI